MPHFYLMGYFRIERMNDGLMEEMVTSGISWYIYVMHGWVVWVNNKASYVWDGMGGTKYNASTQMKNNAKAIMETLGWGGGYLYKAER